MNSRRRGLLAKTVDGESTIDFSDPTRLFPSLPPERLIILLVLLLAIRRGARAVIFEPSVGPEGRGIRMFYEVDDQQTELEPPPQYLAKPMFRELLLLRKVMSAGAARGHREAAERRVAADVEFFGRAFGSQ